MAYEGSKETYDLRKFKTIRAFGNETRNNIVSMSTASDERDQFLRYINKFKNKVKPRRDSESEKLKEDILNSARALLKGREMAYKAFKTGIKPGELKKGKELKVLPPKEMLQRLPIAIAHIK